MRLSQQIFIWYNRWFSYKAFAIYLSPRSETVTVLYTLMSRSRFNDFDRCKKKIYIYLCIAIYAVLFLIYIQLHAREQVSLSRQTLELCSRSCTIEPHNACASILLHRFNAPSSGALCRAVGRFLRMRN